MFLDAHLLYYSTSVYNYVGTFVQVTIWTLSQVQFASLLASLNLRGTSTVFNPKRGSNVSNIPNVSTIVGTMYLKVAFCD